MKNKLSFQKIVAAALIVFVLISLVFGIATRKSYTYESRDNSSVLNASLNDCVNTADETDGIYSSLTFDEAVFELDSYTYIFKIKCIDMEICYDCLKYTANVIESIKGDQEEAADIVIYQFISFSYSRDRVFFNSPDNTLPLKEGKEYLVFAEKRDYYEKYQETLPSNEYALGLSSSVPTALVTDDLQNGYIDKFSAEKFSDISDKYYLCFSDSALNNINKISAAVINYYCG